MLELCRQEGASSAAGFSDASSAAAASLPGDVLLLPPGVHAVEDLGEIEEAGGTLAAVAVAGGGDLGDGGESVDFPTNVASSNSVMGCSKVWFFFSLPWRS